VKLYVKFKKKKYHFTRNVSRQQAKRPWFNMKKLFFLNFFYWNDPLRYFIIKVI